MARLKQLSVQEAEGVRRELDEIANKLVAVGNVIGPAFGAAWCDKALKLHHAIQKLGVNVEDEAHRKR